MTANPDLVLAGLGTPSLAWWAPNGTALPTDASTALAADYLDMGWCAETGADIAYNTETVEIDGFGSFAPVRTLITKETTTFQIVGRETNVVTQALYRRLPLTGAGAPTVATTGAMAVTDGPARDLKYVGVLDSLDGNNKVRKVFPNARQTGRMNEQIAKAQNLSYGMTFTAEPDENGVSVYTYFLLDALKTV